MEEEPKFGSSFLLQSLHLLNIFKDYKDKMSFTKNTKC